MPGTAGDLGIYPAYYDSPYLQVEGGARYLSNMLDMFGGNIIHALAAIQCRSWQTCRTTGGVPPFQETQHYVVVIPQKYNEYLRTVGGIDALGTIDPALLANSNLSPRGRRGPASTATARPPRSPLPRCGSRASWRRIGQTQDVQEAMALNSYARAELVRLIAARSRPESRPDPRFSAQPKWRWRRRRLARTIQFMDFTLEELR